LGWKAPERRQGDQRRLLRRSVIKLKPEVEWELVGERKLISKEIFTTFSDLCIVRSQIKRLVGRV
jgi:hypothetical protein